MKHMRTELFLQIFFLFAICFNAAANPCYEVWNSQDVNLLALTECKQLAENGSISDQLEYGLWLIRLPEKYRNDAEGINWIRKVAQHGNKIAQLALANFLSSNYFDKKLVNFAEAYAWYSVLSDNIAMENVASKMNKSELEYARKLAQDYVQKYKVR